MTKKLTQKLTSMINRTSQREALLTFLLSGNVLSAEGAREAGVCDPRRVVNHLRSEGWLIDSMKIADRSGNVSKCYASSDYGIPTAAVAKRATKTTTSKKGISKKSSTSR